MGLGHAKVPYDEMENQVLINRMMASQGVEFMLGFCPHAHLKISTIATTGNYSSNCKLINS